MKGAVAAGLIGGVGLLPVQGIKPTTKTTIALGTTDLDSVSTLAVWLAITARDKFLDFDPSSLSDQDFAKKLVGDMNIAGGDTAVGQIQGIIKLIRNEKTIYDQTKADLKSLSALIYTAPQCPKYYATLVSMAGGTCK